MKYYTIGIRLRHAFRMNFLYFSLYSAFTIQYPIPIWVRIQLLELSAFSIFLRTVAICTRRDAMSPSTELPRFLS